MNTLSRLMIMTSILIYSMQISAAEFSDNDYLIKDRLNPFEMPSLSISYAQYPHQKVLDVTGVGNTTINAKDKLFTITLDKPIYDKYINYELNFSWFQNFSFNKVDIANSDPDDKDTEFPTILGFDTYLSIRGKIPLYLGTVGDIALTGSSGVGISTMMMGLAKGDTANNEGQLLWYRFGFVTVLSYGINYYPIKWLGLTFEIQNRFYNFTKDSGSKMQGKRTRYKKSFNYSTGSILVFGIKTTV